MGRMLSSITELVEYEGLFQEGPMNHRPFLRSAIKVVSDFRIGDFDRHSRKRSMWACLAFQVENDYIAIRLNLKSVLKANELYSFKQGTCIC